MITESTETSVKFCDLIEHPGGHDGGEFPQYEEFGVAKDGSLFYKTGQPHCSNDSFCDEPNEQFVYVEDRQEAVDRLHAELELARRHVAALERVLAAFERDVEMTTYFDNELYVPDNDEDEGD